MAKIYGLFGSMTGKVADVVMAVRNGEQIARKYQPVVSNPSTEAQVASRAKLKMLSQLSAVCAPVIAIPRMGAVSSRNRFVKRNYSLATYEDNQAKITVADVQLTESVVGLPPVGASRSAGGAIDVFLSSQTVDVDHVVYAMFEKRDDNSYRLVDSKVSNEAGEGGGIGWQASFGSNSNECVVLAYGVRDNSEIAKTRFGNLETAPATTIARLVVTRALTEADITLTETVGTTLLAAGE